MSDQEPGVEPQTPGQEAGDGQEPKTFDLEYVQSLRNEAAKYRTERNDARKQLEEFGSPDDYAALKAEADKWREFEDKNKTDMEKLQEQVGRLETERDQALQQAKDRLIQSAFVAEASKLGFVHPEDAYRLADHSGVSIDDDGKVVGVDKAVKALEDRLPKARQPAPSVDGGAGNATAGQKPPPFTAEQLREQAVRLGLNPKTYAAQWGVKLEN